MTGKPSSSDSPLEGKSPANSSLESGAGPQFGILFPPNRAHAREGSGENPATEGRSAAAANTSQK